ncbi:Pleckstrin homology domain-containing protein [Dipodascopsis tothii]|uniref:Pleckstrin homology domain-containing protein n=1 Tax=Dipodascopsis tothii TaxID=44089 RepID=UPI0034CE5922
MHSGFGLGGGWPRPSGPRRPSLAWACAGVRRHRPQTGAVGEARSRRPHGGSRGGRPGWARSTAGRRLPWPPAVGAVVASGPQEPGASGDRRHVVVTSVTRPECGVVFRRPPRRSTTATMSPAPTRTRDHGDQAGTAAAAAVAAAPYTQYRLAHSTPEHMQTTSRVVLVGPIPSDWLRSHQKAWLARLARPDGEEPPAAWSPVYPDALASTPRPTPAPASIASSRDTGSHYSFRTAPSRRSSAMRTAASTPMTPATPATPRERDPMARAASRSRSRARSAFQSSLFAPSSFASTQTFMTARGSAASTADSERSSTYEPSERGRRGRSRSPSEQSTASTIRPARSASTAPVVVDVAAYASGGDMRAVVHTVEQNAAIDSLSTILDRDSTLRTTHTRSPSVVSMPPEPESDDETEHDSHADDPINDRLRKIAFDFSPSVRRGRASSIAATSTADSHHAELLSENAHLPEFMARAHKGQAIKIDKLLVSVKRADVRSLPIDFNEADHVHMAVVERAREYLVVARYTGDVAAPVSLQFYRTTAVPAVTAEPPPTKAAFAIRLDRKAVRVNLFSSLDKSLVLYMPTPDQPKDAASMSIYIVRSHMPSTSLAWYGFLRNVLGGKLVRDLILQVPDLEASLKIVIPWSQMHPNKVPAARTPDPTTVPALASISEETLAEPEPESAPAPALADSDQVLVTHPTKSAVAQISLSEYIIATALDVLGKVAAYRETVAAWRQHERMGLVWRRYDRIEWLSGMSEQQMYATWALRKTHELELRPKVHYPTQVVHRTPVTSASPPPADAPADCGTLNEPPPVEGFLIRLTHYNGMQRQMGRLFYKQFYFMTHDNLLLFCRPHDATPPPFEKPFSPGAPTGTFVHEFTPFPLRSTRPGAVDTAAQIEWLDGHITDPKKVRQLDDIASSEMYRRIYQLLTAAGFIDLCDVADVRPVERDADGADYNIGTDSSLDFNNLTPSSDGSASAYAEDGAITAFDDERVLELVLKTGLVIRLQAFNRTTRDIWIERLSALRKYWAARTAADARAQAELKADNLAQLHIDEEMESRIRETASKWEALRGIADPQIYNVCGLGFCRSITMKGPLYFKVRKQSTFRKSFIVLSHGYLLVFEAQARASNGVAVPRIYHKIRDVISLKDCYVYSGILTEADLVDRNSSFSMASASAGTGSSGSLYYSLPKIFRDGVTASDDDFARCFVIWRASKSTDFNARDLKRSGMPADGDGHHYKIDNLGTAGTGLIFMARSRMEKELWVSIISGEIGRIQEARVKHTVV